MNILKDLKKVDEAFDDSLISLLSLVFWKVFKWDKVYKFAHILFLFTINDKEDTHSSDDVFILLFEVFKHFP